jgi:DnaJ-domain-containing protein 1
MQMIRWIMVVYAIGWLLRSLRQVLRTLQAPDGQRGTGGPRRAPSQGPGSPWEDGWRPQAPPAAPQAPAAPSPYELLEARPDMSDLELRRAYQAAVQQYHPDQVAHLGIDLQRLAESRTKDINAAYDQLRRQRRGFATTGR